MAQMRAFESVWTWDIVMAFSTAIEMALSTVTLMAQVKDFESALRLGRAREAKWALERVLGWAGNSVLWRVPASDPRKASATGCLKAYL
jgi:hypothetical protein